MIYAIDTNIIYDILLADPEFGPSSRDFISKVYSDGDSLIACDVVWAEASAGFTDKAAFTRQMAAFSITYSPMPEAATIRAGEIWKTARLETIRNHRKMRIAIVPDFLVGAHAMECADALITRDRGFMRRWFSDLNIVDPSSR